MLKNTLEIYPWKINNNYLSSSINNDLNSILNQEWIIYNNSYVLVNYNNKTTIRNFISSNNEKWLIYMKKVYDRLYNWDISYSNNFNKKILEKNLDNVFYVKLDKLFYFQIKKPWINELDTNNNYNSSSRIFKQIFEEASYVLNDWDVIKIDFEYRKTNYSKLWKNIAFWLKMLFKNQMENEELFSTFTDKLEFVECYIKISTNSSKFDEIKDITKKNFQVYKSKNNSFRLSKKKWSFLKLKNKLQIDSLISLSLLIPIHNEFSINNKSKIIPYWLDITSNNLLKKQNENYEVILGKIYKNNIIENKDYLILDDNKTKNKHSIVIWQSWSWKSYSLSPIIAWRIIKSIKEFDYNKKYWNKILVLDPHSSFWNNITNIIKKYEQNNKVNNFKKIIYSRSYDDWYSCKKLLFNPLFVKDLWNYINNEDTFLDILNYNSDTILSAIKWFYDENSFWARNQNLLKIFINFLIILNLLKYENYKKSKEKYNLNDKEKQELLNNSMLFSIWDIIDILLELLQNQKLKDDIFDWLKILLNHENIFLQKIWDNFKNNVDYLIEITKKDKTFIESTINKLEIFKNSLYKTFWWCSFINYTLDLQDLYLENSNKVEFINFDLWDFSSKEKSIISNFLMSYSYYSWVKRDLFDKKLWEIFIYIDEVNSVLSSQNSIENLKNLFYEIRKYKINLNLFYQNSKQKGFNDLYSNTWYIITFSNSKDEVDYLIWDFNSWSISEINPNDIINLNRWSFYILLKTINKNITLSCDWLDFNNEEDLKNIIF